MMTLLTLLTPLEEEEGEEEEEEEEEKAAPHPLPPPSQEMTVPSNELNHCNDAGAHLNFSNLIIQIIRIFTGINWNSFGKWTGIIRSNELAMRRGKKLSMEFVPPVVMATLPKTYPAAGRFQLLLLRPLNSGRKSAERIS